MTPRSLARSVMRKRDAPRDGTVEAFVRWMQSLGECREFNLFDAYEFYEATCAIQGHRQVTKHKRFKDAMRSAGCRVWQADEDGRDGKRTRPMKVEIPAIAAKPKSTSTRSLPMPARSHAKPISKAIKYLAEPIAA